MAENKQSFVLYTDLLKVVEKLILQDRENHTNYAGELFYHILLYVNDQNPIPINFIIELAFEPIKCQLKRDLRKYEVTVENKSNGGKLGNLKRWNNDLYIQVSTGEITLDQAEKVAKSRIVSHTDKKIASVADTVNDNVNDTVNDIKREREKKSTPEISNKFIPDNIIHIDEIEKELLADQVQQEHVAMCHHLPSIEKVQEWIKKFILTQKSRGIMSATLKDSRKYFSDWLRTQLEKQNNGQTTEKQTFDLK